MFRQRWIRFGIIGAAATLFYYLTGIFLVYFLSFPVLFGNILSYLLAFLISYLGQSLWTFKSKGNGKRQLMRFAAVQGLGMAINTGIIKLCLTLNVKYEIAMIGAILIVPIFVYFLCHYWVFPQEALSETT